MKFFKNCILKSSSSQNGIIRVYGHHISFDYSSTATGVYIPIEKVTVVCSRIEVHGLLNTIVVKCFEKGIKVTTSIKP